MGATKQATVILADPLALVREGLAWLCGAGVAALGDRVLGDRVLGDRVLGDEPAGDSGELPHFRVIAQCATGSAAWESIAALVPDVAVLDTGLGGMLATDVIRRVKEAGLPTRVVVISARAERPFMLEVFRAGADGYVLKSDAPQTLLEALTTVLAGRYYLSPILQNSDVPVGEELPDPMQSLSSRELQVFSMLVEGVRAKEIAARLAVSPKTVDTHRASLMRKLNIYDVAGLVKYALVRSLTSLT